MGWASFVEDIVRRFDERSSFAPRHRNRNPRSAPKAVVAKICSTPGKVDEHSCDDSHRRTIFSASQKQALKKRLEDEKRMTAIAIREFRKNEIKANEQKVRIAGIKQKLIETNQKLQNYKDKVAAAARTHERLDQSLKTYQDKFAQKLALNPIPANDLSAQSILEIVEKIEDITETDLIALENESRERFVTLKAYATSERRLMANDEEIAMLEGRLLEAAHEEELLKSFLDQIDSKNRTLISGARGYQGWEIMDEWLKNNPTISPKEFANCEIPTKAKKVATQAFNPLIK